MLTKKNRLLKKRDFDRVHKTGQFSRYDFLSLKKAKNNLPETRIGFLVGLKISKKAVIRNKIKRRLREMARLHINEFKEGFDVVIFVRPDITLKNYQEIEQVFLKLFTSANLLKK